MRTIDKKEIEAKQLYRLVRDLEKKLTVLMFQVQKYHQQCAAEIIQNAEKQIKLIKSVERDANQQLRTIKDTVMIPLNEDWVCFERYAQQLRKNVLGDGGVSKLPDFKLNKIQQYICKLQNVKQQFDSIVQISCKRMKKLLVENRQQISIGMQKKQMTFLNGKGQSLLAQDHSVYPFCEISPIKRKTQQHSIEPEKDKSFSQNYSMKPLNYNEGFFGQKRSQDQHLNIADQSKSINSNKLKLIKQAIESPLPSISTNGKQRYGEGRDLKGQSLLDKKAEIEEIVFEVSSLRSRRELVRVRSEQKIQCGYRNCLDILQKQQLRYDKIKYRIN